jgi:hypothetical protein
MPSGIVPLGVRGVLFSVLILTALPLCGNDTSVHTLQTGSPSGPTSLHDRGIRGEGQIVAVLDTGLDYDNCYFAEPDNSPPPVNTGSPNGAYQTSNVDLSRRKVIAYDFLYSCDQFPTASGCETPSDPHDYDNQGHGTHAAGAIAGDRGAIGFHDAGDAIAPAAKLVIQDAGFIGGDSCSHRPGIGCPITRLGEILNQAYVQGARIHSNSWGDLQGIPPIEGFPTPTANYSSSARQVDEFIWTHPEMAVLFNTGNAGHLGPSSLSAPGAAKNTIDVGGTRATRFRHLGDDVLAYIHGAGAYSGTGPTRDGRIKPDVVGPALVEAGDTDFVPGEEPSILTNNCNSSSQGGTSWASPTIAGAVALIRQYYTEGFYPTGARRPDNALIPSAALLKATLIVAARRVPKKIEDDVIVRETEAVPNYEQGFGFPVLEDALYFAGDGSRLRVFDSIQVPFPSPPTFNRSVTVRAGTRLKVVLVWTDPPGTAVGPTDTRSQLVNDLDLLVRDPAGQPSHGNERLHPGSPDRLNNVEVVEYAAPVAGTYSISVRANRIGQGPVQNFALVIAGDFPAAANEASRRRPVRR